MTDDRKADMHPSTTAILRFFEYSHLPTNIVRAAMTSPAGVGG